METFAIGCGPVEIFQHLSARDHGLGLCLVRTKKLGAFLVGPIVAVVNVEEVSWHDRAPISLTGGSTKSLSHGRPKPCQ